MRISLLEKREDFYKILQKTLQDSELFKSTLNNQNKEYLVNKYLNFISQRNLNSKAFRNLKNEYSNSLVWWKKYLQKIYVSVAISKLFRDLFAQKVLKMPDYGSYLILGGNHRLRLFTEDLKTTWSVLKKGERNSYIENDIKVRSDFNLSYIPKVLNSGIGWLEEEFFEGIPLNRLTDADEIVSVELDIAKKHQQELLIRSKESFSYLEYKSLVSNEVSAIIQNDQINTDLSIVENISKTLDKLFNAISEKNVAISWTHGDFQMANILVNDDQIRVIDWESSAKRYGLYDLFVLFGEARAGIRIEFSVIKFRNKMKVLGEDIKKQEILLCLVEELRFQVCEDFSENFYFCGEKTNQLCGQILQYINE